MRSPRRCRLSGPLHFDSGPGFGRQPAGEVFTSANWYWAKTAITGTTAGGIRALQAVTCLRPVALRLSRTRSRQCGSAASTTPPPAAGPPSRCTPSPVSPQASSHELTGRRRGHRISKFFSIFGTPIPTTPWTHLNDISRPCEGPSLTPRREPNMKPFTHLTPPADDPKKVAGSETRFRNTAFGRCHRSSPSTHQPSARGEFSRPLTE